MRYSDCEIVLQEVPGEITLCFTITGCELLCPGCHSPYLWKRGSGVELNLEIFNKLLDKYKDLLSCVLFMGGEWYSDKLIELLVQAKSRNLKTCLYTGLENIDNDIKCNLTYIKTGPWISSLGGLDSEKTNQKFINLETGENLNHLFRK